MWLLVFTGLRAGELRALRWKDVNLLEGRVQVTHSLWRKTLGAPKTAASRRELVLPPVVVDLLKQHWPTSAFREPGDFLFCQPDGQPIDADSLRRLGIYPALERAGLPVVKGASGCHLFRHTVGSLIHRQTGSLKLASEILGHASVATTGNVYVHPDDREVAAASRALAEALGETVVGNVVGFGPICEAVQ